MNFDFVLKDLITQPGHVSNIFSIVERAVRIDQTNPESLKIEITNSVESKNNKDKQEARNKHIRRGKEGKNQHAQMRENGPKATRTRRLANQAKTPRMEYKRSEKNAIGSQITPAKASQLSVPEAVPWETPKLQKTPSLRVIQQEQATEKSIQIDFESPSSQRDDQARISVRGRGVRGRSNLS